MNSCEGLSSRTDGTCSACLKLIKAGELFNIKGELKYHSSCCSSSSQCVKGKPAGHKLGGDKRRVFNPQTNRKRARILPPFKYSIGYSLQPAPALALRYARICVLFLTKLSSLLKTKRNHARPFTTQKHQRRWC